MLLTVPTAVLLLLHVPPLTPSVSAAVVSAHRLNGPTIAPGDGSTVTVAVLLQPPDTMYVIIVLPDDTPVSTPVDNPIVPTAVLLLPHVPPDVTSVRSVTDPAHT
jgi:hypothetical protein